LINKNERPATKIAVKQSNFIILFIEVIYACLLINFADNFGMSFGFPGSLVIIVAFTAIVYAIVKSRCLSIDRIAYKILLCGLFVGPLVGLHIIISKIFLEVLGYLVATTLSLLIIIFMIVFTPYKKLIRLFLEKFIYQGKYDYQNVLAELCQGLTVIIELDQLSEYLIHVIVQTIDAKKIAFFQEDTDGPGYIIKAGLGIDPGFQQLRLDDNSLIMKRLKQNSGMLIKSELYQFEDAGAVEKLFAPFSAMDAEIVIPLSLQDHLIGIIVLSAKASEEIYNQGDIDVLEIFALEASKALEHARVYSQAIVDNVSRVFNQNYFLMRLREEIARSKRYLRPISLLFIAVEESRPSADPETKRLLLKAIGLLLKTKVRNVDVLARYGNKLFAVILPETGTTQDKQADLMLAKHKQDTLLVANRISQGIENFSGEYKGRIVGLNACIGVACFHGEDKQFSEDSFISQVETALAMAKKNRENKIVCFEREK
jgi:diguanylate cyclase (GGDEF)-like protein